jgi:D-alanyl-D-alanine carboxypeptidase
MDEIEIPEAIREELELSDKTTSLSFPLIVGVILCLIITGLLSAFLLLPIIKTDRDANSIEPTQTSESKVESSQIPKTLADSAPTPPKPAIEANRGLLGHLPYNVASESELEAINADGRLKMRSAAAKKFQQMQAAAKADGIILTPISAFRDDLAQEQLFFGVKEQRVQNATKRAEVSAPPGYSEHHTGYAIDIGDGNAPATNLETSFADTAAFRWLEKNALKYSFELSFPSDNKQGVSYEPWHWRFVGDRDSLETFYKVRN